MRVKIEGVKQTRKAIRNFAPDLNKELNKELKLILKPITVKARGFIPANSPISGWGKNNPNGTFPVYNAFTAKAGIGFTTRPGRTTQSGFTSNAQIFNKSAAGSIYETAGRVNPNGREQYTAGNGFVYRTSGSEYPGASFQLNFNQIGKKKNQGNSRNPEAGSLFVQALNESGQIVDAYTRTPGASGRASRKMKGRAIFRAWKEDQGKAYGAALKAIDTADRKFQALADTTVLSKAA
jgi:hypothetical protein